MSKVFNIGGAIPSVFSAQDNLISFTAPFDCICEITFQSSGWGYDGKKEVFRINCSKGGAELLGSIKGYYNECNLIERTATARAVYKLKKGVAYEFTKLDEEGARGSGQLPQFLAICYPYYN